MKHILFLITFLSATVLMYAQETPPKKSKVVKTSEKVNQKTQKSVKPVMKW